MAERNERHHDRKGTVLEALKVTDQNASPPRARNVTSPNEPDVARLASLIRAYAPHDGSFELRIPGLHASHFS